jgi:trans-aconitate methyltransferase
LSTEWNAEVYHKISGPQVSWGKKVLARVRLRGDERVLDAGCGTGRLTRDLLEALPDGQVTAADVSLNMLRAAEQHLAPQFGTRVRFVQADLQHLTFDREFDGIFSTASFHWVKDHDALFAGLLRALRPRGWLCAQCGGAGNLERFLSRVDALLADEPYRAHFEGLPSPWEFADAATTADRLQRAGFAEIETSTEAAPTSFASGAEYQEFIESVVLRKHLDRLPAAMRESPLRELTRLAAEDAPPFHLDYWRLNLQGRRPAE